MEAAIAAQLVIRLTQELAWYIFVIGASGAALPIFDILGGRGSSWIKKGTPPQIRDPWWEKASLLYKIVH